MFQLLIVEDEKIIREGLRDCVDWNAYEIKLVGEVPNGKAALEFIQDNPVDIVLSDVAMPIMDGIEMVKVMRDRGYHIKVVFVSGYWEMPYLKSAFQLDAIDYILKPVKLDELDSVIRKVTGICTVERKQSMALNEIKAKLAESMPALRERFISTLLRGRLQDRSYIKQRFEFLNLPLDLEGKLIVMNVEIQDRADEAGKLAQEDWELLMLSVKKELEKVISSSYNYFCASLKDNDLVIILSARNCFEYSETISLADKIQEAAFQASDRVVTIGIGTEVGSIYDLSSSYLKSMHALEQKYFLGDNQVIHINDIEKTSFKEGFLLPQIQEKIIEYIRIGKVTQVKEEIDRLFEKIQESCMSLEYVQNVCLELLVLANRQLLELKVSNFKSKEDAFWWQKLFQSKTLVDTFKWVKETLVDASDLVATVQSNTSCNIVEMMKKLIRERYAENLSIHVLAEEFCITPGYVCILFKKETEETFKDFLTKVRMEKAKELLKDPIMKLYEISERVGYKDPEHFSKTFKKYTSMTPSEYRERIIL